MIDAQVTFDTRGLSAGIAASAKYSKRTLPQIVNTAAYWVAVNAKNAMPFVTPQKVDSELLVITHPVIGKRGKPLKNKKRYSGGSQQPGEAPFAVLIVAARANPKSRYNVLTNQRYRLAQNPFKGVSRAAGRAAMADLVDKMIKLRHRSGKFLIAGWIPAIRELFQYAVHKFLRGTGSPMEGAKQFYGANLGSAQPAVEGGDYVSATIENDVGMEGLNAPNFNRALLTYGAPALQMAIDREGEQQMAYALKHAEKELAETVNRHWS